MDDKAAILEAVHIAGMGDADVSQVFGLVAERTERLLAERERSTALVEFAEKVVLTDAGIRLGLKLPVPCGGPGGALRPSTQGATAFQVRSIEGKETWRRAAAHHQRRR